MTIITNVLTTDGKLRDFDFPDQSTRSIDGSKLIRL